MKYTFLAKKDKYRDNSFVFEYLIDENDKTILIKAEPERFGLHIGDVYIGRIDKLLSKDSSCLVNLGDAGMVFYDLKKEPCYFNKHSKKDGPHQGDEIFIKIKALAVRTKYPVGEYYRPESPGTKHRSADAYTNIKKALSDISEEDNTEAVSLFKRIKNGLPDYLETINLLMARLTDPSDEIRIISDDLSIYNNIIDHLKNMNLNITAFNSKANYDSEPASDSKVRLNISYYTDDDFDLNKLFSLQRRLDRALSNKVSLKNGSQIIIDKTEAFYAIDVNSNHYQGKKKENKEDYILKINLEAAEEAVRQMIIRNLSGIILIDFINMEKKSSYDKLFSHVKMLLKKDFGLSQTVDITKLGIMEITRKKVSPTLKEMLTVRN